ncbi:Rho-related GTP-binding protein RhoU [Amphibalanus amphitrite]|uniref:Rho-related GTP-binding protein RhoU n=1 Tax=Amphibalanus amphitrite TaxID=1232801 RepID=A0A6A4X5T6_AMPAM|nr:rho-related GTP-binding protein RhoU-like [Amphibalanus amphitrite]XP_043202338.1 rho-related GTP-binding protein RhoU-like [Amphibalanus amphitrite]XP_043202339.1 rho-related GTP-binding protein RhoU-like [Amphibalanus amphitrite]XP_043202341.1 rho-related GTP-binding protein RhoU-like [Amphibalanus amphitrite]XP_043226145.1 rho-related GTP-binding protein RhoU-like [Amphibalanus amphitrite]XP_043226146.1 rho-related GTP-binding protein RhoU-like [Amphibalanus amphitrite]XP_043226147.1 rh
MLIQTGASPPCSPVMAGKPPPPPERVKCVLVGDGAVGKTSMVVSYATNGYPSDYQPTTYDDYNVDVVVNGRPVKLQLCDTAGQEDFDWLRRVWYSDTDVFVACFSVVSPSSFQNVPQKWVREIREYHPQAAIVLVGTQSDLRSNVKVLIELDKYREVPVTEADARRLAHNIGADTYIECSALTQKNIKEVFDQCILSGLEARRRPPPPPPGHKKRRGWRRWLCM